MILLTAAAGGSGAYRDTGAITTAHLILIAALAALTIAGLLWGMRLKRQRQAAEREEAERAEALETHPVAEQAPGTTAQVQSQRQMAEPVAPPPPPAPSPPPTAPAPPPLGDMGLGQPEPPAAATGYQLSDIKGLGPKALPLLAAQGVTSIADLAALDDRRAATVDDAMGALKGRLVRDRWVEQARLLDTGDRAGFEATFGKL